MAELIIIRAQQHCGKTTTAGLVYKELLKHAEKEHEFDNQNVAQDSLRYNDKGDTLDFTAILKIASKKVAIVSAGDIAYELRIKLKILIEINIDVIICCARSVNRNGSTYRMILEDFARFNNIALVISTKYSEDRELKTDVKEEVVHEIVNETLKIVTTKSETLVANLQ